MQIYVVRHSQTQANKSRIIQGQLDTPLTPEGFEQTLRTAAWLGEKNIARIFASPLGRTVQTARMIADAARIPYDEITLLDGLMEIDLKPWENQKMSALDQSEALSSYSTYKNTPLAFSAAYGENFADLQERVLRAFEQIVASCAEDDVIVVVSHSVAIRTLLLAVQGRDFGAIWEYAVPSSSITEMAYDGGRFEIVRIGFRPG